MKNDLSRSFTLKVLMHLLSLENKLEQSSDNSPMELTFISCLVFIFTNPNLQYLLKIGLMQPWFHFVTTLAHQGREWVMARLWIGTYLAAQAAMVVWRAHCTQEELNGPTDQFPFQWAGATLGLAFALDLETFCSSEKNRGRETTLLATHRYWAVKWELVVLGELGGN